MDTHDIAAMISALLRERDARREIPLWRGMALIGAADARDPGFPELKSAVGPTHRLPEDYLPGARSVLSWFIPFDRSVPESNEPGRLCSRRWAEAYIETNRVLAEIGRTIEQKLTEVGARGITIGPPNHNYDTTRLMSDWSQRHVARLAGLGTFGLHNLLITSAGCTGRLGSMVTDLLFPASERPAGENCLVRVGKLCSSCIARCPVGALRADGFDRFACSSLCHENDRRNADLGAAGGCGKCSVGVPCSFGIPDGIAASTLG